MANEEHLTLIKQGVETWNEWRRNHNNYEILADLTGANLSGVNMSGADLGRANLTGANLTWSNLSGANLRMANLSEANLAGADVTGGDLRMANLRMANLSEANLTRADVTGAYLSFANLRMAYLGEANLSEANLKMTYLGGANLTQANLKMANLSGANLEGTQAVNTNFKQAIFTGSCLENWQIDRTTNLDDVICEYVYLQHHQQERCPSHRNFATGEFTKLFRTTTTADLGLNNEAEIVQEVENTPTLPQDTSSQNLAEVTAEIRQILQQLEQTHPTSTSVEKLTIVSETIKIIEGNIHLKLRVIDALEAADTDTLKVLVNHSLANILLTALEDWKN